jgi:DNA polymerase III gamma/tau subunit
VLDSESVSDMSENVIKEIVRVAEGCPRQALVILDQVIDILDEAKALAAVSAISVGESEVIDICRGVYNGESWKTLKDKLKLVEQSVEPEKIRYAILGYLNAIVLSSGDERASDLIDIFSENTFYSGKAGLTRMCHLGSKK